ncbi:MAG: enoyl-CoA hydratase-related protein [Pseudomonadota bacterium]
MKYETIEYDLKDRVGIITLNRPEKQNAMNDTMITELDDLLRRTETDLDPKVLIIKGAGQSFSIGQDLTGEGTSEIMAPSPGSPVNPKEFLESERRRNRRWEYIFNYPKPTIAQVHGNCIGAGLYLAVVCDLVIASEDAVFGDPAMRMGLTSSMPLLIWLVGIKKAKELMYLGRNLTAKEAEEMGLINFTVSVAKLEQEVNRYAKAISICPGDGLPFCKESMNASLESRGIGAAWRYFNDIALINQQCPFGSDEFNFFRARDERGLEAAVEERDAPFKDLGF